MVPTFRLLYRGPLESCNYGCVYCPFAKKVDSRADLDRDRSALQRFVSFLGERPLGGRPLGVLFTPWGEGLIRRWYQDALVKLAAMPHVERASIQTNLSGDLGFLERAPSPDKIALWATYHPEWVTRAKFLDKVREVVARGARISVGAVGLVRHLDEIERLREELPDDVYLWINAAKRTERYDDEALNRLTRVDPLFETNTIRHPSLGRACRAGEDVVSVDGDGDVRRCHFVDDVLGNLYDGTFEAALRPRVCPNATCSCHIGYVHLDHLELYRAYGFGVLERIPAERVWARRSLPTLVG